MQSQPPSPCTEGSTFQQLETIVDLTQVSQKRMERLHWRLIVACQVNPSGFQQPRYSKKRAHARDTRTTMIELTGQLAAMMDPNPKREKCESKRAISRRRQRHVYDRVVKYEREGRERVAELEGIKVWSRAHDALYGKEIHDRAVRRVAQEDRE